MSTLEHRKMALAAMAATTSHCGVPPSPTEVDSLMQRARGERARFLGRLIKQGCIRIGAHWPSHRPWWAEVLKVMLTEYTRAAAAERRYGELKRGVPKLIDGRPAVTDVPRQ